jgi:hypothetical protein
MKISYAVTVCNEIEEVANLVELLKKKIRKEDEIIILADYPKVQQGLKNYLLRWNEYEQIKVCEDIFDNDFSMWKNKLTELCTGDYIFQIDADELPHEFLVQNLPVLLEANAQFDVFLVPRINTVIGIEPADLQRWNWKINEKGWINFPDYQWRIYRNQRSIQWINKVHERLVGFKAITCLPANEEYSLIHKKTITKQIKQNFLYDVLIKNS